MMARDGADWLRTGSWIVLGPLICMVISLAYNGMVFAHDDPIVRNRALQAALILPLLPGLPLFVYFSFKLRELAEVNRKLGIIAATDGLTRCLNRSAFTTLVETKLEHMFAAGLQMHGAFLIVDADNFKTINDRFGHQNGDEALSIIAQAIRSSVRAGDSVGRIGGEEFGIFLPAVDRYAAEIVAERLRNAVSQAIFTVDGQLYPLSVSVGGVVFDDQTQFELLYKMADERLYTAKGEGRNCVRIAGSDGRNEGLAMV
ncbi:diguanylate cyclase (GGDEF) domain-containing protein [Pelagibacterium luteolum]|uniref:diguanylate cyclase n=2 Tax=Pelagibacterium luteolum TaxID=440168 RepID=A0A1G7X506_9HYPH|nr:diguanylate cyclase (GGDEF) domain-containing protein [Pelagibacterium luteolum]